VLKSVTAEKYRGVAMLASAAAIASIMAGAKEKLMARGALGSGKSVQQVDHHFGRRRRQQARRQRVMTLSDPANIKRGINTSMVLDGFISARVCAPAISSRIWRGLAAHRPVRLSRIMCAHRHGHGGGEAAA